MILDKFNPSSSLRTSCVNCFFNVDEVMIVNSIEKASV